MLYPVRNAQRQFISLDGWWHWQMDPEHVGVDESWFKALPAARDIVVPASWNDLYDDARDYLDWAWYALDIFVPAAWQGQHVTLRVDSANYLASVWVNGQRLGEHEGGHLPFEIDLSEVLVYGVENHIAILVDAALSMMRVPPGERPDPTKRNMTAFGGLSGLGTHFDFFPYSGLNRSVRLVCTPQSRIEDVTVRTVIAGDDGLVTVLVDTSAEGLVTASIDDVSASAETVEGHAELELRIPDAWFWSPDDPYLYTLDVTLDESDSYALEVGIRTIAVDGDDILLNGEPLLLRGFGKHEDSPILGRGLNPPQIIRDADLFEWVGANSYRTSHYPYSEEAMQIADRRGILVIDEIPAVGMQWGDSDEAIASRDAQAERALRELISRDKNHPAVFCWSVANEPMGSGGMLGKDDGGAATAKGTAYFKRQFAQCQALDPTRLHTMIGVMAGPVEWLELSDICCINRYWGWYVIGDDMDKAAEFLAQELDYLHGRLGKPILISEYGADTVNGMHGEPTVMFQEENQVEVLRVYQDVAESRDYAVGLHPWNFADFRTGQGVMRVGGFNRKGVFTRLREPKMAAHFLRERWKKPDEKNMAPAKQEVSGPSTASLVAAGPEALLSGITTKLSAGGVPSGCTLRFDFGAEGVYQLATGQAGVVPVSESTPAADTTVVIRFCDLAAVITGETPVTVLGMNSAFQLKGDGSILGSLLGM